VEAVVIMPKRRPTISIAHADDVPPIAFTDDVWQAIEHAYGRPLNADVRQQISTVTTRYLKDCAFERSDAPKALVQKLLERRRRAAGNLKKVMLDREAFSVSSDELSREQQQSAHSYADHLTRRYFGKLDHFRDELRALVVAYDCTRDDLLRAAEGYRDGQAWDWWIQGLTEIAQRHELPYSPRIVETSGDPSAFVALVRALQSVLQEHVPARHMFSDEALAKAIQRAQARARDK
jgi:hypothetical protein